MAWVRIDDQVPRHQKFLEAGPAAAWFWVCGVAHCQSQLTDGFISMAALPMIGIPRGYKKLADQLVHVGLWEDIAGGYRVHDYLTHNDSREKVVKKRADDAARKARGLQLESDENPDGIRMESGAPRARVPSHPLPTQPESPVPALMAHYHDGYLRRFGEKPNIEAGKDGGILKTLAKRHGQEAVTARIDRLLDSTDAFIATSGRTIGILQACWNKLAGPLPSARVAVPNCRHHPTCVDASAHTKRDIAERQGAA